VRGEGDDGLAKGDEEIVAIGRGGEALHPGVVARGQRRKMREEIVRHRLFMAGGRIEINERARECEQIHAYLILSGRSERKGRKREEVLGLLPLDSAPSDFRMTVTWLRPGPNRWCFSTTAISAAKTEGPFARVPEANSGKPTRLLMAAAPLSSPPTVREKGLNVNE